MGPADEALPPSDGSPRAPTPNDEPVPSPDDRVPETLISVDIEASGPSPSIGSLIAIGACLVAHPDNGFYREIQPLPDLPWDEATEKVHRLTREHLREHGVPLPDALHDFAEWIRGARQGPPVFVGFNAPFDWMFVADAFHRHLGGNPFGFSALDLKALYMGRHGVERWSETRRLYVARRYGLPIGLTHNALEDARAQAEVARLLLDRVSPPVSPPRPSGPR